MLPDSKYYQYISHIYESKLFLPLDTYSPSSDWDYSEYDKKKFQKTLIDNKKYITNKNVLDLGCHTGFMCYIAHTLGAKNVIGVNARSFPIKVGQHFIEQLGIDNVKFILSNIEDFNFLETICKDNIDTVVLSEVLEHCKNIEKILEIISNCSSIKNIIIRSNVINDDNTCAKLFYTKQETTYDFNGFNDNNAYALVSCPNRRFLETILYFYNWKITNYEIYAEANLEWFGIQKLDYTPHINEYIIMSATKE